MHDIEEVPSQNATAYKCNLLAEIEEKVSRKTKKMEASCYLRTYDCEPGKQYKVFTSLWIGFIVVYAVLIAVSFSCTPKIA